MRSHNCQSIQPCRPIASSRSSHTNHAGQYSQSPQNSQARQATRSRDPSRSSQRRKDRDPCHSSRPSKSTHSSQHGISVQSRKHTHSSQPLHRVFDTAREGFAIDRTPNRRSTKFPCRIGNIGVPTGRNILQGALSRRFRG